MGSQKSASPHTMMHATLTDEDAHAQKRSMMQKPGEWPEKQNQNKTQLAMITCGAACRRYDGLGYLMVHIIFCFLSLKKVEGMYEEKRSGVRVNKNENKIDNYWCIAPVCIPPG